MIRTAIALAAACSTLFGCTNSSDDAANYKNHFAVFSSCMERARADFNLKKTAWNSQQRFIALAAYQSNCSKVAGIPGALYPSEMSSLSGYKCCDALP